MPSPPSTITGAVADIDDPRVDEGDIAGAADATAAKAFAAATLEPGHAAARAPREAPLSISLVTETFPPEINGVAMTLGRLVRGLADRGHRIQVVRPRQPGDGKGGVPLHERVGELLRPGVPIPRYQGLRLGLPSRGTLTRAWREQRPDVVHVATEGPLGYTAMQAALALGIPLSSSYHTNFHDYSRHYGFGFLDGAVAGYLRRFHNRARCTMAPSDDLIATLHQAGYRNLVRLARGVDTALFSPARRDADLRRSWGVTDDGPDQGLAVIHVGRVAPEKNIPLALAAFARIRALRPEARMVVVGDGPLRPPLAALHGDVRFTGALPVEDLARHYASADLFLFPSMSETFGNVLLEAMASGCATVSFDYAAARTHVRHGENGLLAPFDDAPRFTALASALATDPARLAALGQAARAATETIAWSAVVDRFAAVLRQVIDPAGDLACCHPPETTTDATPTSSARGSSAAPSAPVSTRPVMVSPPSDPEMP